MLEHLLLGITISPPPQSDSHTTAFKLYSKAELKASVVACVEISPVGDCANGLNGPIGDWDMSRVTDLSGIFHEARAFNGDISKWDVSTIANMFGMFAGATAFNGDISTWDVSSVTDMSGMFHSATEFNGDISKWDVSSVINMSHMFDGATAFNRMLCGAWLRSKAWKENMFRNSPGSMCPTTTSTVVTSPTGKYTNKLHNINGHFRIHPSMHVQVRTLVRVRTQCLLLVDLVINEHSAALSCIFRPITQYARKLASCSPWC